jgi:hypothetical protein
MIGFLRAHGLDAGPLQHPLLAGALAGLLAAVPAGGLFIAFGSFEVVADQVMRLSHPLSAAVLIGAFAVAGLLYGGLFRRGANDRRGGWLFGAAFGFLLWMAAPVAVLPLIGGSAMAAGRAATGFFASFILWGAVTGAVFPWVHARMMTRGVRAALDGVGDRAAASVRLLRRIPGAGR